MADYFVSDLHMGPDTPAIVAQFETFIAGLQPGDSLYLLGDIFEVWVGDDDDEPVHLQLADALARCADNGVSLYFMAGNRDFLLGDAFAARARLTLLDDPHLIERDGHRFLLSHGDAFCTDDHAYLRFRAEVRDPAWAASFLAKSLAERKAIARGLRVQSEAGKREKPMALMDVSAGAVAEAFRQHGYPVLIHGHTHRPAKHLHHVDGKDCTRWVLPDWHDQRWGGLRYLTGELTPFDSA